MARGSGILRVSGRADAGMTLVELMVAAALGSIVLAVFASMLISAQGLLNGQQTRSVNNDQARLASEHLDRHVRSSSGISSTDGYDLIARTWSNPGATEARCAQWLVTDGELRFRTWPQDDPDGTTHTDQVTAWNPVARGIVNAELNVEPFTLTNWAASPRSVEIRMHFNDRLDREPDATVSLEMSATGRNIPAGPPPSPLPPTVPLPERCSDVPAP